MADISEWDPADEANTDAPPNGWPEFMQPSAVNNCARAMMGAVRRWYDTVTSQIAGLNTTVAGKVSKTGDTMTGGLLMDRSAGGASDILGQSSGSPRWLLRLGGPDASGANLEIYRYADNGSSLGSPMSINRQNGIVSIGTLSLGAAPAAAAEATRKDYVDQRDTATYNAAYSNITTWANNQDIAHYNNAVNYATSLDNSQRAYIDSQDNAIWDNLGNRVWKDGDTMSGALMFTGGMGVVNNTSANRHYLQFVANVALVYEVDTGRMLTVHPGSSTGNVWIMTGNCYADAGWVGGHGPYVDMSDLSLKEQIAPAPQGLDEILRLQPKTFIRKPRFKDTPARQELGFVAQDVQQVLPHAVVEVDTKDGPLLGVASEAILAAMVTAMRQMHERIETLEGRTA
jgi:Chaperone of endosialidase